MHILIPNQKQPLSLLLVAPKNFWSLSDVEASKLLNGCGTHGIIGDLVPDSLFGTNLTLPCNIHDYMYAHGNTKAQRKIADQIFLQNMIQTISLSDESFWLSGLKKLGAYFYYLGVRLFGGFSFRETKSK